MLNDLELQKIRQMYPDVPDNTIDSLIRYVNNGIPTGSFLEAVLSNDLFTAVTRADQWNKQALPRICELIYNYLPGSCHGSHELYKAWLEAFRR